MRFGLPSDLAETWLSMTLGRFKRAHPTVLIEAEVDRNALLLERLDRGGLDLALVFGGEARSDAEHLATLPMKWIGPATGDRGLMPATPPRSSCTPRPASSARPASPRLIEPAFPAHRSSPA